MITTAESFMYHVDVAPRRFFYVTDFFQHVAQLQSSRLIERSMTEHEQARSTVSYASLHKLSGSEILIVDEVVNRVLEDHVS